MRLPTLILALGLAAAAPLLHAAGLQPYRSEAELAGALERWRSAAQALMQQRERRAATMSLESPAAPAPAMAATAKASADAAGAAAESITNVQTAGVDEGGIVKRAGDHLVILRRGRLFTVRVGGDQLQPIAQTEAYAPGIDPRGAWYDELLISGNTVVVVGYSYARGGTEIGLFELGDDGSLRHRATHHLRSFDYYSARNYASRLVGTRLVFYTPTLLQPWGPPWMQAMPAQRRWQGAAMPDQFERILPATQIYRTDDAFDPTQPLALHTVTGCDLARQPMRCESMAVLGPAGRVFYVSAGSVYVWTQAQRTRAPFAREGVEEQAASALFRLPLDGGTPSAIKTVGQPSDQMSFLEDDGGHLNVLLREWGPGEGMGGNARSAGRTALLRLPLSALGDGRTAAPLSAYRRLPGPAQPGMQNRFVGDWLLWGAGSSAWAVRYAQGGSAVDLEPGHAVERIEALGRNALLVGQAEAGLQFSAVNLGSRAARIEGRHVQAGARQAETRTHGFFYRATGADEGLLGLPVLSSEAPSRGPRMTAAPGAAVVVLRQRGLSFSALGDLAASGAPVRDDGCKASCVDWYGNARPLFLGERIVALMGYELVEGRLNTGWGGERLEERRRVSFAPRMPLGIGARPTPFD